RQRGELPLPGVLRGGWLSSRTGGTGMVECRRFPPSLLHNVGQFVRGEMQIRWRVSRAEKNILLHGKCLRMQGIIHLHCYGPGVGSDPRKIHPKPWLHKATDMIRQWAPLPKTVLNLMLKRCARLQAGRTGGLLHGRLQRYWPGLWGFLGAPRKR